MRTITIICALAIGLSIMKVLFFLQNWKEGLVYDDTLLTEARTSSLRIGDSKAVSQSSSVDPSLQWPPPKEFVTNLAEDNTIIITIINCGFLEFLENWLLSIRRQNLENVMVIALDKASYEAVNNYWPGHVVWPQDKFGQDSLKAFDYDTKEYAKVTNPRPSFIRDLIQLGVNVVYSDVDMTWLGNALEYVKDVKEDFAIASDSMDYTVLCTCFLYFKPLQSNMDLLERWSKYAEEIDAANDQVAFNPLFNQINSTLSYHLADVDQFPPGFLYFQKWNIPWNPTVPTLIVHANWMWGAEDKMTKLQAKNLWYAEGHLKSCGLESSKS